jgi:hypothetical protein
MNRYSDTLDRLERRISGFGISGDDPALEAIGHLLAGTGTLPGVAAILTDPNQPEPVRMRALSRAMGALRAIDSAA